MSMEGKGVLFPNAHAPDDKRPDFKGNIEIDGKKYDLAAWKNEKTGDNGEKTRWLSVKLSEPRK